MDGQYIIRYNTGNITFMETNKSEVDEVQPRCSEHRNLTNHTTAHCP